MSENKKLSIIIPFYNEGDNILLIYEELNKVLTQINYDYEIIFVDDGSDDGSAEKIKSKKTTDASLKLIEFSRNFGKEIAVTAGINNCQGDACIMMDADLQHPPDLIPEFIKKWESGKEVIIGVRKKTKGEKLIKKIGSYFFYKIINQISETKLMPYATDYRLIDRAVIDEFNKFTEKNRIARGIIDWMGFKRDFIYFDADERVGGKASYSFTKLVQLAFSSFVSLSLFPLKLAGYLGIIITVVSGILGIFVFVENYVFQDPLKLSITGTALLALMILFLVGIILICLGFIALYIAHIQTEVLNRPLYIIRKDKK